MAARQQHGQRPRSSADSRIRPPSASILKLSWLCSLLTRGFATAADRLVGTADFTRTDGTDAAVNFDWGDGSPGGTIGVDNFSARWTCDVGFTQAGIYRFTMRGDDGMRLFIRNNTTGARTQVSPVGAWRNQGATTCTFDVPLTACTHRLEFEFYESGGQASAQLSWVRL